MGLELAPLPADPADVRAQAMSWRQSVGAVDESGRATRNAFATVLSSWFGSLYDLVSAAPQPMQTEAERLQAETVYNAGVLDFWAEALQVLQDRRNSLIAQFDNAAATDYGAKTTNTDDVEPDNVGQVREQNREAVNAAKNSLRTALQGEYGEAVADLDDAAAAVARMMEQGATPENLRFLYERGALGLGDVAFFPDWRHLFDLSQGLPAELQGKTAAEIAAILEKNPELARWAMGNQPGTESADPAERALALALATPGDAKTKMDAIRAAFNGMSEEDRNRMAVLFPGVVGNLNGAPFDQRAKANRVAIVVEVEDEKAQLQQLKDDLARVGDMTPSEFVDKGYGPVPDLEAARARLNELIGESEGRLDRYNGLLNDELPNYGAQPGEPDKIHRQVIYFQPNGNDAGVVTLEGSIDGDTKNVGVFVPGTGTKMSSVDGPMNTAGSFVAENGGNDLAMITWAGSGFPTDLEGAISGDYAREAAPKLAEFSYALDQEIAANSGGNDVQVTTAGHSYGGSIVGLAQTHGLYTDKVLHIESAGMGVGVTNAGDYHPPSGHAPTSYTMTAPGDPIAIVQGSSLAQGADPTDQPGFIELETGNYPAVYPEHPELAGKPVEGQAAHGGVVIPHTGAWWNMYGVFTDGQLDVVPEPPPPDPNVHVAEPPPSDQQQPPPPSEMPPPGRAPTPPPPPPR